jgi:hypothetical protein
MSPTFRTALFSLILLFPSAQSLFAAMPLQTSPSWTSIAQSYVSTGGAWADVDGDGWLDMVVANGNDISRQSVVVYRNNGDGTLPTTPTWASSDIDYHGHLDVGDINGDGLPDLVVAVYIGPAGFDSPGRVKAYYNTGLGTFSSTPNWTSASDFYCFSVALGDADGDGDLDLACATGEDYYNHPERKMIFYNTGSGLETSPSWESDEIGYALDVFWDDVDQDGDMDVVFCGTSTPMRVYLNGQTEGGGISTTADWENADLPEYGNTTCFGDWNGDGYPDLAVADNFQLGGNGYFKVYENAGGTLATVPTWTSNSGGYGSHVSWIDLDVDGDLDLATGRWWGPATIYENTGGDLTRDPVWTSTTGSVIENMFWGDVDNDGLRDDGRSFFSGDGTRTYFRLGRAPVRSIESVRVDGVSTTDYAAHLGNGWVSLADPPADGALVEVDFSYSYDVDLGVTNWDQTIGNYLFRNTGIPTGVPDVAQAVAGLRAYPNPLRARTQIAYDGASIDRATLSIHDATGRRIATLHNGPVPQGLQIWEWDRRDQGGRVVPAGIYYARFDGDGRRQAVKLVALD